MYRTNLTAAEVWCCWSSFSRP